MRDQTLKKVPFGKRFRHRLNGKWKKVVAGMLTAGMVLNCVESVTPAVPMNHASLEVTAQKTESRVGEPIQTEIHAMASEEWEETYFVIRADGENAGMEDTVDFGQTQLAWMGEEEEEVELHREYTQGGDVFYWFYLEAGMEQRFSLSWMNGISRYEASAMEEEETASESNAQHATPATASNAQAEEKDDDWGIMEEMELVRSQEGDISQNGTLKLSYGTAKSLYEAKRATDGHILLSWSECAKVQNGHDFTENIKNVTVSKQENGQWISGEEFIDGDKVRIDIQYTIPAHTVGGDHRLIYYQLPDGIELFNEESGIVYSGQTPVGTYEIDTSGMIRITFDESFADDKTFTGMIRLEGTLSVNPDGTGKEIEFGNGGISIMVKPQKPGSDIRVNKSGRYDAEEKKLYYTVTAETNKGTQGSVTISDYFSSGTMGASYLPDTFEVIHVRSDGTKETITDYQFKIQKENQTGRDSSFRIEGLPKLEAGEKYEIQYAAIPSGSGEANGASHLSNSVTASSGSDNSSSWNDVRISQEMVTKWGTYDANTQCIKWTVTINKDKQEIGAAVLEDFLTVHGVETALPSGTNVTLSDSSGNQQSITLPYVFPTPSRDTYTLLYETPAPQGSPGQSWHVNNKVQLKQDGETYQAQGSVSGQSRDYQVSKQFQWEETMEHSKRIYHWLATITVPDAGLELEKLTYIDTMKAEWTRPDGTKEEVRGHQITFEQLKALTVTTQGTTLVYGVDYQIQDLAGTRLEELKEVQSLNGFQIVFLEHTKERLKNSIQISYATSVDLQGWEFDGTYAIQNTAEIPNHKDTAQVPYEPVKKLEKQASASGEGGTSYTDQTIKVDFEKSKGVLHYRLLISTDQTTQGKILVHDKLPKGTKLLEDSVKVKFYGDDYYEYDTIWGSNGSYTITDHIKTSQEEQDGHTNVQFQIEEGYRSDQQNHKIVIYYEVSFLEDPNWEENPTLAQQTYRNEAYWENERADTKVTVEREIPLLKKTGQQLPQYDANGNPIFDSKGNVVLSNTIRYWVIINAGAQDLMKDQDSVTLKDQLHLANASGATLLPERVKVYHYDPKEENGCGQLLDQRMYSYTYDEQQHQLIFQLPDATACVVSYDYIIDRGNLAGDLSISNEVHLTGGSGTGGKNEVILKEVDSMASASHKELKIYKVDAENYAHLLEGAIFSLEVYENGVWKLISDTLKTNENGEFTLYRVWDEESTDFGFQDQTLYRLTETVAPEGYAARDVFYYFVWVADTKTLQATRQEMIANKKLGDVDPDHVKFLIGEEAIYVPNNPVTLKIKKIWENEDGTLMQPPKNQEIQVQLLAQTVESNARKVSIVSTGNQSWSQTYTQSVEVAQGSNLSIQINGVWLDRLTVEADGREKETILTGNGQQWTYTLQNITEDVVVYIRPESSNEGNSFGNISLSGYGEPYEVPKGEAQLYETVTLDEKNDWSYRWTNLPKETSTGERVVYRVKELTKLSGYQVMYSANNTLGIQNGELVLANRSLGTVLPQTGGGGTFWFTTGGLIAMIPGCLMYFYRYMIRKRGGREM